MTLEREQVGRSLEPSIAARPPNSVNNYEVNRHPSPAVHPAPGTLPSPTVKWQNCRSRLKTLSVQRNESCGSRSSGTQHTYQPWDVFGFRSACRWPRRDACANLPLLHDTISKSSRFARGVDSGAPWRMTLKTLVMIRCCPVGRTLASMRNRRENTPHAKRFCKAADPSMDLTTINAAPTIISFEAVIELW